MAGPVVLIARVVTSTAVAVAPPIVILHEQQLSKRPETWLIVSALSAFVFPSAELVTSVLDRIGALKAVAIQGGCQS